MRKIVEFFHKLFLSVLIVGILSFLYISIPATDYSLSKSEKYFDSTEEFVLVYSDYIGKVVDIKGEVTLVDRQDSVYNIILDSEFCFSLDSSELEKSVEENNVIIIKGRFTGFDAENLFEPYSFTYCSLQ